MTVRDSTSRWPLVGRNAELNAFAAGWADRRCDAVVLTGPAGAGKSRVAEECLARAAADGWSAGRVMASAAVAAVPLGAMAHLVPAGVDLSDPVHIFAEVSRALAGPGRNRRWAMMVDDLHLLDATSAVLIRQLLDARVVRLIATVRTGEPVGDTIAALTSSHTTYQINLAPFDREQTEGLLQRALGGPVGRLTVHALHEGSGGNVLYLRELVLGALNAGKLVNDGEIWELTADRPLATPKLTELISARLAAADPRARDVLDLLALCEPVALADAEQAASIDVVADLEAAGLIHVVTERRRTSARLTHPLYGEVLRAQLPVLRRRQLLLAQVERFKAHGSRRREDVLRLATWQLAATGTAEPALLTQAASLARYVHDYPQAVALLQAIPAQHHTVTTRLILAEALFQMGGWEQAETVLVEASSFATDDREKLAVTLARTTNPLCGNAPTAEALALNESALARSENTADRHILLVNEGYIRTLDGQPAQGLALLGELENDLNQAPDAGVWLRGAFCKTTALAMLGRSEEAAAWASHAYAAHLNVNEEALVSDAAIQQVPFVLALMEQGKLTEAAQSGEQTYTALGEHNTIVAVWLALMIGRAHWLAGHPRTARHWYAEAAARTRTINHEMGLRPALSGLAASAALLGDLAAARTALAEYQALPPLADGFQAAMETSLGQAWLHAASGRLREARAILSSAAKTARETGHLTSEALLTCYLFSFRLSYSGKALHRVFASCGQEAFFEGHVHALRWAVSR
ncbi:AAA family ATPase [Streptomyces sp. NPDC052013]|uniref:AAA family ATPase n=1 Tax=Streptomyces sp. NPDC052013 TaxID=3365679 RepID=UPI0037CEB823